MLLYIITYATNLHIALCNCGSSMHTLDHAEPEVELRVGQAQVKASTNLVLDQGKS
jgi:hypothetical protein